MYIISFFSGFPPCRSKIIFYLTSRSQNELSTQHRSRRIITEAIELEKRPNDVNIRVDNQLLPISWKTVLNRTENIM